MDEIRGAIRGLATPRDCKVCGGTGEIQALDEATAHAAHVFERPVRRVRDWMKRNAVPEDLAPAFERVTGVPVRELGLTFTPPPPNMGRATALLSPSQRIEIEAMRDDYTAKEVAEKFNVSVRTVRRAHLK